MCGIFGAWGVENAAVATFLGLHSLQHRGQESVGIGTLNGTIEVARGLGILSADAISLEQLTKLKGDKSVGQVRYSTQGDPNIQEAQPFEFRNPHNGHHIAYVHNGQLNGNNGWQTTRSDSERFGHAFAQSSGSLEERVFGMLSKLSSQGSYALCMLTHDPKEGDALIVAKDPHGNRPLVMGKTQQGGYVFASEDCALQSVRIGLRMQFEFQRELAQGEVIIITKDGMKTYGPDLLPKPIKPSTPLPCFFEAVYFARPDSHIFGHSVHAIRQNLGRQLAIEAPVNADIIVPVPDSAQYIAEGYARQSGIQFEKAITRSHYIGRTFIDPARLIKVGDFADSRLLSIVRKFGFVEELIHDQRIVLVDDSIVRGNTMRSLVKTLYELGAKEVHLRIGSPPTTNSCYFGINTPTTQELIANGRNVEQIMQLLDYEATCHPTSLQFLSYEGTMAQIPYAKNGVCDACVTGDYKMPQGK